MVGRPEDGQPGRVVLHHHLLLTLHWLPNLEHLEKLPPRQTLVQCQELGVLLPLLPRVRHQGCELAVQVGGEPKLRLDCVQDLSKTTQPKFNFMEVPLWWALILICPQQPRL